MRLYVGTWNISFSQKPINKMLEIGPLGEIFTEIVEYEKLIIPEITKRKRYIQPLLIANGYSNPKTREKLRFDREKERLLILADCAPLFLKPAIELPLKKFKDGWDSQEILDRTRRRILKIDKEAQIVYLEGDKEFLSGYGSDTIGIAIATTCSDYILRGAHEIGHTFGLGHHKFCIMNGDYKENKTFCEKCKSQLFLNKFKNTDKINLELW